MWNLAPGWLRSRPVSTFSTFSPHFVGRRLGSPPQYSLGITRDSQASLGIFWILNCPSRLSLILTPSQCVLTSPPPSYHFPGPFLGLIGPCPQRTCPKRAKYLNKDHLGGSYNVMLPIYYSTRVYISLVSPPSGSVLRQPELKSILFIFSFLFYITGILS